MTDVALAVADVHKSFGATAVLRGVTFDARAGEVHALLGENGAGKSTLMKILLGATRADRGTLHLGGAPYVPADPRAARRAGVVMVPQERTLCPHLSVVENIVLGIEPGRAGVIDARRARELATTALTLVTGDAARIPLEARSGELGVADQQLVEIARALAQGETGGAATRAKILILDEPTSSLGRADADRLFERVHALRAAGMTILLVSHFLDDVRAHADRYTVLRDGAVQGGGDAKATPAAQIVFEMLGRELEDERRTSTEPAARASSDPATLLEVRDLALTTKPVAKVTFTVHAGEIFGIAGLVGSGRTELLRAIVGLDRRAGGEVRIHGKGIGLLSEDRGGEGLMLARSIADNIALSRRGPLFVNPRATLADGARWISTLAIRAADAAQSASELSGGNQQKVQIARLLREDYDVLLVDEPTRGIDVGSKAQILTLFRELARANKAIVIVSSQLDEILAVADRVAVLRKGALGEARSAAGVTHADLLLEAAT